MAIFLGLLEEEVVVGQLWGHVVVVSEGWGSGGVSELGSWSSVGVSELSDWSSLVGDLSDWSGLGVSDWSGVGVSNLSWGSGVGEDWSWGSNSDSLDWLLVDVWLSWDLLVKVWLSWDLLVQVWLGWDLLVDVGLGCDLLVDVGLGGNLLVDVWLGGVLLMDVGLGGWVDLSGVIIRVDGGNVGDGWASGVTDMGNLSGMGDWGSGVGSSGVVSWGSGVGHGWESVASIAVVSGSIGGGSMSQVLALGGGNGQTGESSDKSLHCELMNC